MIVYKNNQNIFCTSLHKFIYIIQFIMVIKTAYFACVVSCISINRGKKVRHDASIFLFAQGFTSNNTYKFIIYNREYVDIDTINNISIIISNKIIRGSLCA